MKVTSLLLAIVALSSCVAKPWMVGSVNDHYTMHAYAAGDSVEVTTLGEPTTRGGPLGWLHRRTVKRNNLKPLGPTLGHTSNSNPLP